METEFEDTQPTDVKSVKHLLPIKTRGGIVPQQIETEEQAEEDAEAGGEEQEEADINEAPIEDFEFVDNKFDLSKPILAAQLLTERNKILREKKIHIGTLSAGVLENPEQKVTNLRTLLQLMDEEAPQVYFSVRKLATVSLLEIFKDILPGYEIKKMENEGVKCMYCFYFINFSFLI